MIVLAYFNSTCELVNHELSIVNFVILLLLDMYVSNVSQTISHWFSLKLQVVYFYLLIAGNYIYSQTNNIAILSRYTSTLKLSK